MGTTSLKAKALQYLAQRDHSRQELRQKLLRWEARKSPSKPDSDDLPSEASNAEEPAQSVQAQVDSLLDWLIGKHFLSDERFAQSRVHARQSRFGNRRITDELRQHGVVLDAAQLATLQDSETERALRVLSARFVASPWGQQPPNRPEQQRELARQQRFLAARGFSADAIRQAMKRWRDADSP